MWLQRLFETYERCAGNEPSDSDPMMPVAHTTQQAHIEVVINENSEFRRARVVAKENTVIPATEGSSGRTSGDVPHALCDKIQYCAGDYLSRGGMKKKKPNKTKKSEQQKTGFEMYVEQLERWCNSEFSHPKVAAVLTYVKKGKLVEDLVNEEILLCESGQLVVHREMKGAGKAPKNKGESRVPEIFKQLTAKDQGGVKVKDQGDALVRWIVESSGEACSETWNDKSLQSSWSNFYASQLTQKGFCMVSGVGNAKLAEQHPAKLRHGGDKAKLISANDSNGFTYMGRFLTPEQAAGVSFDITQKAHNALQWLIRRQAYRSTNQEVFVSWATGGKSVPDPHWDTISLFLKDAKLSHESNEKNHDVGDVGQAYANRLNKAIRGYRENLKDNDDIVIMGLDSATTGRMAITYYRELKGSEFLDRIEAWHSKCAWMQCYSKDKKFMGAPAPRDIAEAAFHHMLKDAAGKKTKSESVKKLIKATVERLMPCIVDGQAIPRDLVNAVVSRTSNRLAFHRDVAKKNEQDWEKNLGIACSLFRAISFPQEDYHMTLETSRTSRDYLFGRLLAVAEHIEEKALYVAGENRDTNAARLMQRYSDRPYSTWLTIEKCLTPYKTRLQAKWPWKLFEVKKLLDEIICQFNPSSDFMNDRKLSGEFLLGYHCQRQELNKPKIKSGHEDKLTNEEPENDVTE